MSKEKEIDEISEAKRGRSPSYPFISLKKAAERAEALSKASGRAATRSLTLATAWGYREKSSGLLQTTSTLKQYGLIEDIGSGTDKKIQLTDLAWRILKDARPGAKEEALKEAAVKPKLMAEYLPLWLPDRPSDSHCVSELELDRGFTEESAKSFIKVFDENVEFANLKNADNILNNLSHDGGDGISASQAPQRQETMIRHQAQFSSSNKATFPLPEGLVALELPSGLSKESKEDVAAWFELMLKRASRPTKKEDE